METKIFLFIFGLFIFSVFQVKAAGEYPLNFVVSCISAAPEAAAGSNVVFAAGQSGGALPVRYDWSGDIYSKGQVQNAVFGTPGVKTVWVTATDALGRRAGASCFVNILQGAVIFNKQTPTNTVAVKTAPSKTAVKSNSTIGSAATTQNKYDAELVLAVDPPETKPVAEAVPPSQAKIPNVKNESFVAALFPLGGDGQLLFVYLILIIIGLSGTVVYLLATRQKLS